MAELREDPLHNRWVIISKERSGRPSDFVENNQQPGDGYCPFCEGSEDKTPPEIFAIREGQNPNQPGWIVRVVPNKFPALHSEQIVRRWADGMYNAVSGTGAHEVVIEHPKHIHSMADFEPKQIFEVLKTYRHRLIDLYNDKRFRYVMVFKNYGMAAGATLSHPHSQIIAIPIVPSDVKTELEAARIHYARKERCIFCDMLNQELESGKRLICSNDKYVAYAPYASRFPFQTIIMPKQHNHRYIYENDESLHDLSLMLKDVLTRLKLVLNDPSYNIILHTSPNLIERPGNTDYWTSIKYDYHWYLEIMPRLTKVAGFEWGTGFYINPTPPEDAAEFLRG